MKKPICEHCGEYTKCVCTFYKCSKCGVSYSNFDSDESHQMFEYRGFMFCGKCFDSGVESVDRKRKEVMEITEKSVESQRKGEFVNNRKKYHLGNVALDGLPIVKIKEPKILEDYENGII